MMVSTLLAPRRIQEMAPKTTKNESQEANKDNPLPIDAEMDLRVTLEAISCANPLEHYEKVKQGICDWLHTNHAKTLAQRGKIKAKLDEFDEKLQQARDCIDYGLGPITSTLFTHIENAKPHMRDTCMDLATKKANEEASQKKKDRDIKQDLKDLLKIFDENCKTVGFSKLQKIYSSFYRGAILPPIEVLKKKKLIPTEKNGETTTVKKDFQHTGISPTTKKKVKTGINIKMWKAHLAKDEAKAD